ncbi:nuclear transcription factor Y subunit gamma-like isoform X2 [Brevipalpus obovatus]|uniref:nuclear transcription factor Y subunit gamma-like isoform X2 n=1 Tax=Brevipalpus obovatus TaxID=246614 RepID=UPI003D9E34B6
MISSDMSEQTGASSSSSQSAAQHTLDTFWPRTIDEIKSLNNVDFKNQELPLARIKKIMKLDDDVKVMMISAEAPVLFAKAAELFITELSLRAWIHTEDNKRRTLQRNDIAMAISKYDQFDFLIDIVPRDEMKPTKKQQTTSTNSPGIGGLTVNSENTSNAVQDQVQYYFSLGQQQGPQTSAGQPIHIVQGAGQTGQTFTLANTQQLVHLQLPNSAAMNPSSVDNSSNSVQATTGTGQNEVLQISANPTMTQNAGPTQIQIVQPMIAGGNGELVQSIPIQLTQQQLHMIRMQIQGQGASNQPIIVQTAALNQSAVSVSPRKSS